MRYLLDTSVLLAHHRQEAGWEEVQALFQADGVELLAASVSLTELGRRIRELGANEDEVADILSSYQLLLTEVVAVDVSVARAAFVIGCHTPQRLPLIDALIAAAAQAKDAVLVHRDDRMRAIPVALVRQQALVIDSTQ
jgi:predicted nucleic acid-binding protein